MARRVTFQPAIRPGPLPILQDAPLPSQKTWANMMSRLKNKYGRRKKRTIQPANKKKAYQAKLRAMVLNPQKKKTIRPANKKKAYQAKLRAMVLKPPRKKAPSAKPPRRKAQYMSLQELVRSFPGANQKMRVYPNQSTLCSIACRAEGAKKKLHTFLKM